MASVLILDASYLLGLRKALFKKAHANLQLHDGQIYRYAFSNHYISLEQSNEESHLALCRQCHCFATWSPLLAIQRVNMVEARWSTLKPATLLMSTAPNIRKAAPTQARREACESSWMLNSGPIKTPLKTTGKYRLALPKKVIDRMIMHVYKCQKWKNNRFALHRFIQFILCFRKQTKIPVSESWVNAVQGCGTFWMLSLTPHLLRWCGSDVCNHKCSAFGL